MPCADGLTRKLSDFLRYFQYIRPFRKRTLNCIIWIKSGCLGPGCISATVLHAEMTTGSDLDKFHEYLDFLSIFKEIFRNNFIFFA